MTLWGGRFSGEPGRLMSEFQDSIRFDRRLYAVDIRGSVAYARALARAGLLEDDECDQIQSGLEQVLAEFDAGGFELKPGDEDIHTAVERRLGELIGPLAGKLHTGRSRNDQVATDLRLYLMEKARCLDQELIGLQTAIVHKARQHIDLIMPGYTHLQPAQPVLFGHWLLAYFWKLKRDRERLAELQARVSVLPLGSGALAGNPFGVDREVLAADLGLAGVAENSIDAVADRDCAVEFLSWSALLQVHLSALAEDLILWASPAFGYVELDEAYSTGSSLMPQKRNPDSMELVRAKSGRIFGHLLGLLAVLKGLPAAYNKDLQEDKEALFDAIDTLGLELPVVREVIRTLKVNGERMAASLDVAMLATDLADYLVRKGVPFRTSHQRVGQAVRRAEQLGTALPDMDLAEYRAIEPAFDADLYAVFDFRHSVAARDSIGGTAPAAVWSQLRKAEAWLA
jgi:argininosuccinate lyase